MKRKLFVKALVPFAAIAATVGAASPASAVQCIADPTAPLGLPNPLLLVGSSAVANLVAAMGTALANASTPVTILYSTPGSCQGANVVIPGIVPPNTTATLAPVGTGTATYYPKAGGAPLTCTLNNEPSTVLPVVALSDVSYTSCRNVTFPATLPAGVAEFVGPIQTMNFIVPFGSTANSISAQAAYFVFGFEGSGGVMPWANTNMNADVFVRGDSSGTQSMLAIGIGAPAQFFHGTVEGGSGAMLTAVGNVPAANANSAIGILSSDIIEGATNNAGATPLVKGLAFQAYNQDCPYYPNSASGTHDKQNVRDGHYALWGPERFYTAVNASNVPTNMFAAQWVGYFNETVAPPFTNGYQDLLKTEINQFLVPQCAMKVQRANNVEIGPVSTYTPTTPCGCFFDSLKATAGTSCAACTLDTDCKSASAPKCHYGYCEAN